MKEKKLKNCITRQKKITFRDRPWVYSGNTLILILIFSFAIFNSTRSYSQEISLEYIFQDTNIVNPRPALKYINNPTGKIFYYADDDYDGMLSLFDYNYLTGETYKYSDTGESTSEYVILPNGNALSTIKGDVYVSFNFADTRSYTKDIKLTSTDEYEYSPQAIGNFAVYRRSGNYFLIRYDSLGVLSNELQLTYDESDSISYQLISFTEGSSDNSEASFRLAFARYDNSPKKELFFPDYTGEFLKVDKRKRGISNVRLFELEVVPSGKDSIRNIVHNIDYPDSTRYSAVYCTYSPDGTKLLIDAENLERNIRKIFLYDVLEKKMNEIYSESYSEWFERHENATRFTGNGEIIFESEISGYNSIYKISAVGSGFTLVAGGDYTITESALNRETGKIYFIANIERPYDYNIYETDISGGEPKQLTFNTGDAEELRLSPDRNYLFFSYSYITKPDELYMVELSDLKQSQITNTISPKFSDIEWSIPEVISFTNSEDGTLIHALLYKPADYNPKKKYPLICFAHGSGYLQNVTNGFSPYRDNFLVDKFLTDNGFMVLDVDYRGSMGYGRDFRNKTHKNMGYWEVSDYISGVEYLKSEGMIDPDKVGIYGGSYGGFITLMAMFRHSEIFKCGIALRAVSNWKMYSHSNKWFTLPRLGDLDLPGNELYYETSSPIAYVDGLQGPLLLMHGMQDDNVFFQDMVQLTQILIDKKKDFDVMIYPKENHGFYRQSSWLDQYKRVFKFFEKNLK